MKGEGIVSGNVATAVGDCIITAIANKIVAHDTKPLSDKV